MTASPTTSFAAAVQRVVTGSRPGQVMTYAEVAAEAGSPGAARAVGQVLRRGAGLPWWRVVRGDGRLVPGLEAEHARHLRAEGVPCEQGHVTALHARRDHR